MLLLSCKNKMGLIMIFNQAATSSKTVDASFIMQKSGCLIKNF